MSERGHGTARSGAPASGLSRGSQVLIALFLQGRRLLPAQLARADDSARPFHDHFPLAAPDRD